VIGFWITAVLLLGFAIMVVRSTDLIRAVLWLAATLVMTSVAYLQLQADLLAGLQVLLYTGGIVTLMLFAVLLTWEKEDGVPTAKIVGKLRGALCALAFFTPVAYAIVGADLPEQARVLNGSESAELGALFLTRHVLAFEALSVLLLAVMIGAIVLSRRSDPS
jgi:NADH-quinone oxidoreductase subunit J